MSYCVGEIVLAWINDPDHLECVEPHPAVVFRADSTSEYLWVVGITGSFSGKIPWYWMRVHTGDSKDPQTGLYKDCVLKANWVQQCHVSDVVMRMGFLDEARLNQAIDKVLEVARRRKTGEPL